MQRTIEQAKQLSAKLRALPHIQDEQRKISKQEEIRMLASEISTLIRERNWTIQQVAEYLTREGLEISSATLKNYLQRSKSSGKPSSKKKPTATKEASCTPTGANPTGMSIGERAAAALPSAQSDHRTAQAAIMRPDRTTI